MLKTTLTAIAVIAFGALGTAAGAQTIKVGANIGNVPWEFQDASGEIVGFEIDLMTEVGRRLGRETRVREHPVPGPVRGRTVRPDRCSGVLDHHHREAARIRHASPSPTTTATSR